MATLFFSYSHKDEALRDQLEMHLAMLKRQGVIEASHDRRIVAGDEFSNVIADEIQRADIILLLVSPDFLASAYCYEIEMTRAIERHASRTARVIPVILRHCDWHQTPFGKLTATPRDGRPIITWPDIDEAFLDVVKAVRTAAGSSACAAHPIASTQIQPQGPRVALPRSSNLRIRQQFSDADKDQHIESAFEYMAKFFEGSLAELELRHANLRTNFRRIDADTFTSIVYRDGKTAAQCRIARGGFIGKGITYSADVDRISSGINDTLTAECDDQAMFLKPMMSYSSNPGQHQRLSLEGAAEYYWEMLIKRLR